MQTGHWATVTLALGLWTGCSGDSSDETPKGSVGGGDAATSASGGSGVGGSSPAGTGGQAATENGGTGSSGAAGNSGTASGGRGAGGAASGGASGSAAGGTGGPGGSAASSGGQPTVSDAGSDASDRGAGMEAGPAPEGTPTIVAVGYAGLRVTSYDLGRSWTNKATLSDVAADDPDNLRGATWGAGLFIAVGHKIFTSPDGEEWTRRTHPKDNAQWLGDVKYGNGRFVATGGYGYAVWSADGITWNAADFPNNEASRSLAFGNGEFVTQTDPGNWYRSTDGETWTPHSNGHDGRVAFCNGAFRQAPDCGPASGHGVFVRSGGWNSGEIDWSENGTDWNPVTVGFVGGVNGFAFGYAP